MIGDLKNIQLNDLPAYDDRYIKTKIKSCGENEVLNKSIEYFAFRLIACRI